MIVDKITKKYEGMSITLVFWRFQGVWKCDTGLKWVNVLSQCWFRRINLRKFESKLNKKTFTKNFSKIVYGYKFYP